MFLTFYTFVRKKKKMPTFALIIMLLTIGISILIPLLVKRVKSLEKQKESGLTKSDNLVHKNQASAKINRSIGLVVSMFVLAVGVSLFLLIPGCSSTEQKPIVVLLKDNKKYVYHAFPSLLLSAIENQEVVETGFYSSISVYPLNNDLYIAPSDLLPFAMLIAQHYEIVHYDQRSHQGFFMENDAFKLKKSTERIATDKIGQTEQLHRIQLSNSREEKSVEISWSEGSTLTPLSNCEIKSVWVVSNPYPGKTVGNYSDRLLVNITNLIDYLKPTATITLDEEHNLLLLEGF